MFYNLLSITRLVTFSQRTAIFFALLLFSLFKLLTHSKNVIDVYPALALTLQFRPRELGSNLFPKYLCLLTSPITVGFTFYKPVVFKRSIITNLLYSNATLLWVLPCFILSTYVPCYKRHVRMFDITKPAFSNLSAYVEQFYDISFILHLLRFREFKLF